MQTKTGQKRGKGARRTLGYAGSSYTTNALEGGHEREHRGRTQWQDRSPEITDPESHALEWVPVDDVEQKELHPAFASTWQLLKPLVRRTPTIIVDAANVVGTVPDGWWKDRKGSTERLRDRIEALAASGEGVRAAFFDMPAELHGGHVFPDWVFITESTARGISTTENVRVVDAKTSGDDAIVEEAAALANRGGLGIVVTSDNELRVRSSAVGVETTRGSKQLLDLLGRSER